MLPRRAADGLGVDVLLPLLLLLLLCSERGSPIGDGLATLRKGLAGIRSAESVKRALAGLEKNGLRISWVEVIALSLKAREQLLQTNILNPSEGFLGGTLVASATSFVQ